MSTKKRFKKGGKQSAANAVVSVWIFHTFVMCMSVMLKQFTTHKQFIFYMYIYKITPPNVNVSPDLLSVLLFVQSPWD